MWSDRWISNFIFPLKIEKGWTGESGYLLSVIILKPNVPLDSFPEFWKFDNFWGYPDFGVSISTLIVEEQKPENADRLQLTSFTNRQCAQIRHAKVKANM